MRNIQGIINNIRQDMAGKYLSGVWYSRDCSCGTAVIRPRLWIISQASLKIQPDNPEAMFYVGRLYRESGDTENANAMFDKVVGEHAGL